MNKLSKLLSYLNKNSYSSEAELLYKIALGYFEEKYKNDYPEIYESWEERENSSIPDKPWAAYANMLKQLEDKNIQFEKTNPYTFDEIKNLLTHKKEEANIQERNELLEYLNQNLAPEEIEKIPSEEELKLAKQNGLSKEVLYLIRDQQNHPWIKKLI